MAQRKARQWRLRRAWSEGSVTDAESRKSAWRASSTFRGMGSSNALTSLSRGLPLNGAHWDLAHCKYLESFSSRADAHGVNAAVVARLVEGHGFPERAISHGCS